jgi:ubiquinone/menaquinone biosynthesis C-methylase UbiE
METTNQVSWSTYAQKYDMLLDYNPFYQQLFQEVFEAVQQWDIHPGDLLADIGAGTGNYSLEMARHFPQATVLHIDKDEGMNAQARKKKNGEELPNHKVVNWGVEEIQLQPASVKGLISIHAMYTFPDPAKVLRQMYEWLEPGGKAVLVNAGRVVNVLDWQLAIGWHMIRQHGIRKTLKIFKKGKEVSKQNTYIRDMQRKGIFWTHNHQEFCRAVQNAGFEIRYSKICFRGISDFVVAGKQSY